MLLGGILANTTRIILNLILAWGDKQENAKSKMGVKAILAALL